MEEVPKIGNRLIFIYDRAQDIHDVSLVIERLADEMVCHELEGHDMICGVHITIDQLLRYIREQLQLIMAAADGKDIANPEEGGEQVA
ncbi:MAG: hypothetical protein AB1556_07530 [Bacillota bacterium]